MWGELRAFVMDRKLTNQLQRMMKEIYSRHPAACWAVFVLTAVALVVWLMGERVPAFPADYRGVWRDERGVGVTIAATSVQWMDSKGRPTKRWECERLHSYPGGISFSLVGKDERICIEWNLSHNAIQFGFHEEVETGPTTSMMHWTPQSWHMKKVESVRDQP